VHKQAIHIMSEIIAGSSMDPITKTTLLRDNVTIFHDVLGGCERLVRAPIPVSYTRHTARFLFV
jgi:putative membrane protein